MYNALALMLMATPAVAAPVVVTDIPPVHALVAQVMGDLGAPVLLLEGGGDAHSFQMRPSQAQALAGADLLVWVGPEMTPWLERAAGAGRSGPALGLLAAEGTVRRGYGDAEDGHDHGHGHDDDHNHAHDHDHDHTHDDEHHHHDGTDPHAWLDPANAQHWLSLIAAELARIAPENAATYTANAQTAAEQIATLDADLQARMAPLRDRPFVVFHDAYGYFTDHYGLTIAGSVAAGDATTPGAARLAGLRRLAQEGGALCAFPEAGHDPRLLTPVLEGSGLRLGAPLDPEGSALPPGPGLYAALLTGMATALADCLTADD